MAEQPKPFLMVADFDKIEAAIKQSAGNSDLPTLYRQEASLLRYMAQAPHNEPVRKHILALARRFDDLAANVPREPDRLPIRHDPGHA